jgi:DNA-binding IclR family transcriptional regulator
MKKSSPCTASVDGAQSISRAATLLRAIASRSGEGSRLVDLARLTELERPTAHRILQRLVAEGLLLQNAETRRYQLGPLVFELGLAAAPQFNLKQLCESAMSRIAEQTGDTVFLSVRSGFDSVCLDRKEGRFPIRTLTLDVGTRRPLGVGAGGMALLMALNERDVHKIILAIAPRLQGYGTLSAPELFKMIERARKLGYALNDRQVTPGAISVGLPVLNPYGSPYAAISVGAIAERMTEDRRDFIASVLRHEILPLQKDLEQLRQG